MKFFGYIRDRMASLIISAFSLIVIIIFLLAFKVETQVLALVAVIFIMSVTACLLWDYGRRKDFYKRLEAVEKELDKKYLLAEMMEEPGFLEGRIFTGVIADCNKSMADHVSAHRRANREFREYIEMWVHEVKIPVSSLRLMCHNRSFDPQKMTGELKRIDDYIDNVLYYSRAENAEKDYLIKEIHLEECFKAAAIKNMDAVNMIGADIKTRGLGVSVMTDGKWLEFIFGQLLDNSMKYKSPERRLEIEVVAETLPDRTVVTFKDNGIGIVPEDLPHIFDKSFTGHNGRTGAHSTGMGLYIIKSLCRRLGHDIKAESLPGSYTAITITFGKNDFYIMTD